MISFRVAGIVGEIDEGGEGYYIWTHKKFDIGYNVNQIVDVNLTSEAKVKLAPNIKITFTYEVSLQLLHGYLEYRVLTEVLNCHKGSEINFSIVNALKSRNFRHLF